MDTVSTVILLLSLVIVMLGMGLSLTIADFTRVLKHPKPILLGLGNQLILLPLVAFGLALVLPIEQFVAVGLLLVAACPGGPSSNLLSHLSRADVALSVSITSLSSIITIFTIPLVVSFALYYFMGVEQQIAINIPKTIGQLFLLTIFPISIGMLIRHKNKGFAERMETPAKRLGTFILIVVIVGLIMKEWESLATYFQQAGTAALLLNVTTMVLGYLTAKAVGLVEPQRISITLESGIQNGSLAISIATFTLGDTALSITPGIYGIFMYLSAFWVVRWANRRIVSYNVSIKPRH